MGLSAKEVVNLFEKDEAARKRLAELLVSESDVRLAIINAVVRDIATKQDIEKLRSTTKQDIEELRKEMISLNNATNQRIDNLRKELRQEISELRKEVHSNFKWVIGVILTVWGATVIPILMRLVGFI